MIRIPEIRKEIEKFLKKDYLKSEIKKIKAELKSMDIYQRIPEPTLKHLSQLEDQFGQLSKKISQTQKTVDKEFNNALKMIEQRKGEASKKIVGLRDYAFEQRDVLEDRIREQIQAFSGKPVKAKKKSTTKTSNKKATKKKSKTTKKTKVKASAVKESAAKKTTTKKKTKAKKKVARKTTKKKITRSK